MSDDNDKKLNKNISLEDADLWRAMTGDVRLLPGKTYVEGQDLAKIPQESTGLEQFGAGETIVPPKTAPARAKAPQGHEVDRRTETRLRKGKMPIEARLDLHGFNQDQARVALNEFILSSHAQGKRCVLLITGKGKSQEESQDWFVPKPGILKQRVPEWLRQEPIKSLILKAVPATHKDGGSGALYILIRRQRTV